MARSVKLHFSLPRGLGRNSKVKRFLLGVFLAPFAFGLTMLVATPSFASPASCTSAGSTGLTTALVASANETISNQTINAAGCDVGIYIGPGVTGVTISGDTITGANDHGIFAQDTSNITVSGTTVQGNGVNRTPGIGDDKALMFVGTSNSVITGNTVMGNLADGGIGVYDDGPIDLGAPNPGTLSPANNVTISNNSVSDNYGGCAIVVSSGSANVPAAGVTNVTVSDNILSGAPGRFGPYGPVVGGIIVAGRKVSGITVQGNTITGQAQPAIVVHSNAPGDSVDGVTITGNTMSGNDWLAINGAPVPTAIVLGATQIPPPASPTITGTTIENNVITGDFYGIWIAGATGSTINGNSYSLSPAGSAVYNVPPPGRGYWMAGSDGGVFSFGDAGYFGSMAGKTLNGPVVGLASSPDQGGYWMAGSDGGVFSFGDAGYFGSMAGKTLNKPIVGMTSTPDGKGYWLVASDGGVFSFGDAGYFGSMAGKTLNKPILSVSGVGATLAA